MLGIRFAEPLVAGRFVRRLNRFAATVLLDGGDERVHVRNSGRLRELLTVGRPVLLEPAGAEGRRTRFTLALVRARGSYVSLDAHLPNDLVAVSLARGAVAGFRGYRILRREVVIGRHRVDFLLGRGARECLLEVKSVTLVRGKTAYFPDAPTTRGSAHLEQLIAARASGRLAAMLFVIQRADALAFAPNRWTDPVFASALERAAQAGVRVRAMTCRVTRVGVRLDRCIPVLVSRGCERAWPGGTGPNQGARSRTTTRAGNGLTEGTSLA
jgi:sugar fermentation stimulation protein A